MADRGGHIRALTNAETRALWEPSEEFPALVILGLPLIEPASGGSDMVRLPLDALHPAIHLPLDIS